MSELADTPRKRLDALHRFLVMMTTGEPWKNLEDYHYIDGRGCPRHPLSMSVEEFAREVRTARSEEIARLEREPMPPILMDPEILRSFGMSDHV